MNTTRSKLPSVSSMMTGTPYAIAFSKSHGLRRRKAGARQPYLRWACEPSWPEGRAVCPPTAAEWPLSPFSNICFGRRSVAGAFLSFITSHRHTPAPKGLRNIAQGQPSLSEATLGMATHDWEANPARSSHAALTSSVLNAPPLLPASPTLPNPAPVTKLHSIPE